MLAGPSFSGVCERGLVEVGPLRIREYWIEKRGLELDATDELAGDRDEDQREIARSEGVAMVLLAVAHPLFARKNNLARSRSPSAG